MHDARYDRELDVRGLSCPMPIVKARMEVGNLQAGEVLRVVSTDRGSLKDFEGWAKTSREIELIAQATDDGDPTTYVHYVKRLA